MLLIVADHPASVVHLFLTRQMARHTAGAFKLPAMPDTTSVPLSLFHTGRAQCPDCGAALALLDQGALVRCQYCGGTAVVERRLRTLEPVIPGEFVMADAPVESARQIQPSQIIGGVAQDESHCPTCGIELEMADTQAIRTCRHCGTQSKIERRLLRNPDADEALAARERAAAAHMQKQFDATEKLLVIVETETDLAKRVRAGWELGEFWIHVNLRAARVLPRIIQVLRSARPELEMPLAELVGKLLCNDDLVQANAVLRAAEKCTFDVNGSQTLLRELSLGSGIGLKLLLDTADYAGTRGAVEYACSALWAVNTMIERNYADRMRLAEIVLYRLLYLKGPVQAWAIELAKGQMGLGCRFPTPTLLHFIDDCAAERPELVPHIRQCFYVGLATTEAEFLNRLELVDQLLTIPAKTAALEHLYAPPETASDAAVSKSLARLLDLTSDPNLGTAAIRAIVDWIDENLPLRECLHQMVRERGDALPEEIRRSYLRKMPDAKTLSPLPVKYQNIQPEPRTAFDQQLEEWKQMWGTGIRAAAAKHTLKQAVAREYWKQISSAK
jgi:DNA-directed RNA polymerase subunit RPC12/RpoP